ncbi:MAG: YqaA family protein [Granulosicoccaceae bacterium]
MVDALLEWGLTGMFVAAFLAATVLPLGSEVLFSVLLSQHVNPVTLVWVATTGNVLGSLTNYALGYWGGTALAKRWLKMGDADLAHAEERFQRFGLCSLLLAWVPVIGDPITVVAGFLRVPLLWFVSLVTLGKGARYGVLAYMLL